MTQRTSIRSWPTPDDPARPPEAPAPVRKTLLIKASRQSTSLERLVKALGVPPVNFAIARQMARALDDQARRFQKMLGQCRRTFSEEAVHDTRVSCRRLIARLTLVRAAMNDPALTPMLRPLKRLLKSLGELRDVQVQNVALTNDLHLHPAVAGLWMELAHREEDLIKAGAESVAGFKAGRLARQISALCAALEDPVMRLGAKSTLHATTVQALREAFDEVLRRRQAIVASRPATVHRVRVAYKKFRYMVESLPPALGRVSDRELAAMAEHQKAMGDIQDVEVRLRMVEAHLRQHPLTSQRLARYRRTLLRRRRELIRQFIREAEGLTLLWPDCLPVPVLPSTPRRASASGRALQPPLSIPA